MSVIKITNQRINSQIVPASWKAFQIKPCEQTYPIRSYHHTDLDLRHIAVRQCHQIQHPNRLVLSKYRLSYCSSIPVWHVQSPWSKQTNFNKIISFPEGFIVYFMSVAHFMCAQQFRWHACIFVLPFKYEQLEYKRYFYSNYRFSKKIRFC